MTKGGIVEQTIIDYLMDSCVFEFVLIICVKDYAVFIHEAHDRSDPTRAPQKVNDYVEKPVLSKLKGDLRLHSRPLAPMLDLQ